MMSTLKPWPLQALWLRWRSRRSAHGVSPCVPPAQTLRLPPHRPCWLNLTRGEVLHLQQGQLLLSPQSAALDAGLALPAQPLRQGETWVAERTGRVLLQAGEQPVALLRRPA